MKKILILLFVSLFVIIITRLFCGVYVHDEFSEKNFFIKHRPTWKWKFYSPIGMSDMKINELSKEKQIEQKYFDKFIVKQGWIKK